MYNEKKLRDDAHKAWFVVAEFLEYNETDLEYAGVFEDVEDAMFKLWDAYKELGGR